MVFELQVAMGVRSSARISQVGLVDRVTRFAATLIQYCGTLWVLRYSAPVDAVSETNLMEFLDALLNRSSDGHTSVDKLTKESCPDESKFESTGEGRTLDDSTPTQMFRCLFRASLQLSDGDKVTTLLVSHCDYWEIAFLINGAPLSRTPISLTDGAELQAKRLLPFTAGFERVAWNFGAKPICGLSDFPLPNIM
ncbi:hypothetical protein M427DRAFT_131247 [Gonapodya prolifera JEL478]|uniref:Uncharacterized protein n=1 Tax=Gonapodya prolifera (strain JEL478) TaxID=1344416 RepID=A0A139AUL9_GONPJ|nr:hypothetical protein M427DRAFT_131247 [Gonapodya prolifera JEL478]|eukprot:KXS20407.1 hypothetical protein M427DRAFT_131247 [Gonapodya prolifera JEL478]